MKVDISETEIDDYKNFTLSVLKSGRTIEEAEGILNLHLKAKRYNVVDATKKAIKEFKNSK